MLAGPWGHRWLPPACLFTDTAPNRGGMGMCRAQGDFQELRHPPKAHPTQIYRASPGKAALPHLMRTKQEEALPVSNAPGPPRAGGGGLRRTGLGIPARAGGRAQ